MEHITLFTDILPEEQERMRVCFKVREEIFQNGETIMEYSSSMKKIGLILYGRAILYCCDTEGNQYLIDELGYDPAVYTGITKDLGGNLSVKQLKKMPEDWRNKRNARAAAYHAARRAKSENRKIDLKDQVALATPKPQAKEQVLDALGIKPSLTDQIKGATDRGGRSGW